MYEIETYKHNDAIDFMLLEEDYKRELRKQGVHYGYSRGSVSGSIIAYLLGITDVDSIKYNLNFERFMNKERISLQIGLVKIGGKSENTYLKKKGCIVVILLLLTQ